jgi:hypothetical protein
MLQVQPFEDPTESARVHRVTGVRNPGDRGPGHAGPALAHIVGFLGWSKLIGGDRGRPLAGTVLRQVLAKHGSQVTFDLAPTERISDDTPLLATTASPAR